MAQQAWKAWLVPGNGAQLSRLPRQELQLIYELALRASTDPKYNQLLDSETGEPIGEDKRLAKALKKIRDVFQLEEPRSHDPRRPL